MRILVSSDVVEEMADLGILLDQVRAPALSISLHGPRELHSTSWGEVNDRSHALRHQAGRLTPILRILELANFMMVVHRTKPDVIVSGYPMVKHRLASKLYGIPHIAYFRGLMFDPSIRSGYSDKVRFSRFGRILKTDVFDATKATHILTVSETNRRFLMARGAPAGRISLVGALWLEGLTAESSSQRRVIFLTSALAAHGFEAEHRAQVEIVRRIAASEALAPLRVRVHPRDFYAYERDPRISATATFDRSPPIEFLRQLRTSDILVAPLSTLAFEALHLGARVVFYDSPGSSVRSSATFAGLGAVPLSVDELLKEGALDQAISGKSIFAPADASGLRTVLDRVCGELGG